jgi:aryl-alcohol dehydrogenase-like predicted oxidoreductase
MASFPHRVTLGRSGLSVGPLGVSGGYGVGTGALLRAFDRGVNYFYHGSRRNPGMTAAIKDLVAAGHRDDLIIALQSYARFPGSLESSLKRGLAQLGIETADVLLLGWYNGPPGDRLFERAERMRENGMFRHLAVSGHRRGAFVGHARNLSAMMESTQGI